MLPNEDSRAVKMGYLVRGRSETGWSQGFWNRAGAVTLFQLCGLSDIEKPRVGWREEALSSLIPPATYIMHNQRGRAVTRLGLAAKPGVSPSRV